jgi:hypothetical protein
MEQGTQAAKNESKNASTKANGGAHAAEGIDPKTGLPAGMVPVASDLCHYKPDTCSDVHVRGYLIDHQQMPPADTGPWSIFVIQLTEASKGEDRDGKVQKLEAGGYVAICVTHTLKPMLQYARMQNVVFEIFIKPKEKVKIGGGKTMWTYNCGAFPKPLKRVDLGIMPPGAAVSPQLGTGDVGSSEIPF